MCRSFCCCCCCCYSCRPNYITSLMWWRHRTQRKFQLFIMIISILVWVRGLLIQDWRMILIIDLMRRSCCRHDVKHLWLLFCTAYLQYPEVFIVSYRIAPNIMYSRGENKPILEWMNQYQSINRGNFSLYISLYISLSLPWSGLGFKSFVCLWVSRDQQGTYNRFWFLRSMFSIAGRTKLMRCDGCAFRKKNGYTHRKKKNGMYCA